MTEPILEMLSHLKTNVYVYCVGHHEHLPRELRPDGHEARPGGLQVQRRGGGAGLETEREVSREQLMCDVFFSLPYRTLEFRELSISSKIK